MRRLIASLLILFILLSCDGNGISLESIAFEENGTLRMDASISGDTGNLAYRLVSPDQSLVWEGSFTGKDGRFVSEQIAITPGASFMRGEYHVYIYSDKGGEISAAIEL